MEYTSYKRVKAALEHTEPDRVPLDIGGTMVTGINVKAMRRLRKYLGLEGDAKVLDKVTQMARTDDDLIERLKIDVKNVPPKPPSSPGLAEELGL